MTFGLTGRVALITGVSRRIGIGAAIAHALADAGADIFTTYYRPYDAQQPYGSQDAEATEILDQLRARGVRAAGVEADLADPQLPHELFAHAQRVFGHVDILVNNAAYGVNADLDSLTAALLDQHYAVNVRAMLLLCQVFAQQHDGRPGGRIINLTSGQSLTPMPTELPYAATKAAIEGLTLSLSRALAPKRVTVNTIDPGATETGWISAPLRQELLQMAPFGRIGTPADAARLVRFLASDEGQWITGQVIHSRGGM
jgi:3-oxoacyl-[acyl-carrier protein] reductase